MADVVNVNTDPRTLQNSMPFMVFIPGLERYNQYKPGTSVTVKGPNGESVQGTVQRRRFGYLMDLVTEAKTPGQGYAGVSYDPNMIADDLRSLYPGMEGIDTIDAWYFSLAIVLEVPVNVPPTPVYPN